jgi:hypothetical protein
LTNALRIIALLIENLSLSSQKYGLRIRDPEKTFSGSRIKLALVPGSGSTALYIRHASKVHLWSPPTWQTKSLVMKSRDPPGKQPRYKRKIKYGTFNITIFKCLITSVHNNKKLVGNSAKEGAPLPSKIKIIHY